MANEFIARKGIIVLSNGAQITGSSAVNGDITASGDIKAVNFRGSGQFLTDIAADSVQFDNILNKPTLVSSSSQISYTGITNVPSGIVSSSTQVVAALPNGTVSSSGQVSYTGLSNIPAGIVSSSGQVTALLPAGTVSSSTQFNSLTSPFTGSFTGSFTGNGSGLTNVTAVSVDYVNVTGKPALVSSSGQIDHDATTNFVANEHIDHSTVSISAGNGLTGGGDITTTRTLTLDTGSAHFSGGVVKSLPNGTISSSAQLPSGTISSSTQVVAALPNGTVSSSGQVSYTGLSNIPAGIVSSSTQVTSLLPNGTVTASSQIDHDATTNFVANEHIDHSTVSITAGAGLNGGGDITTTRTLSVNSGSMLPYYSSSIFTRISGDITIDSGTGVATIAANSVALGTDTTGNYAADVTAGSGIAVTGTAGEGTSFAVALDTGSATFTGGVVKALPNGTVSSSAQLPSGIISSSTQVVAALPNGTVSASSQVDVRNTTGIATIATTGSNTFTGIQTISDTTNSTDFTNGALIVQGGVGIAKDVNISGSLTVTGLLTAVSMSTQYVTSSQYTVGTSRVIVNDDDNVRFAGLSVIDSGSTAATGSLLWDSLKNHWIYEREDGGAYNSAVIIAGPKNYGSTGNEEELIAGRVPVATGGDHIDTNLASSSIYIDFTTRRTHIEAGLYVTGAITSSVGFSGNGAGLTNVAASSVDYANIANKPALVSSSGQIDHDATTNFVANEHIDHSTVSITAGAGLTGGGNITATRTLSVDSGSMLPYYSSSIFSRVSGDILINSSTGVATIQADSVALGTDTSGDYVANITAGSGISSTGATTGENISHTISVDTGSAHFVTGSRKTISSANTSGADGINLTYNNQTGVISGSLVNSSVTVNGQTVSLGGSTTVTANTTNALTLGNGLTGTSFNGGTAVTTAVDTGSTHFTSGVKAKLNADGVISSSAQVSYTGLTGVPSGIVSSSTQFTSLTAPFTGSFTGSFVGDGSNLTGVAATLAITGSTSGTGTIALKTQGLIVSGVNGVTATVNNQTLTISGSNATTTTKGVASFNSTNFTVTGGEVTSNNISINGTNVTLGGTRNITLGQITAQGASTSDQITLNGGAIIHGVLYTSSSVTGIAGPVTNQVVATIPTGSYDAAHFDYVIKDGTNFRTGTVMTIWKAGAADIEFTDTSTNDIGNTIDEIFTVDTNAGNVRLKLTAGTGTWAVKTAIRLI